MKNQEKIFVIGHKTRIRIPFVLRLLMRILRTVHVRTKDIFPKEQDRSMKRRNMFWAVLVYSRRDTWEISVRR